MGKLIALFFHSIASLDMAACACASLIFTSFTDFPYLLYVEPKYLNLSTSSSVCPFICILLVVLCSMLLTRFFALVGADFHAVFGSCFPLSLSVLLHFSLLLPSWSMSSANSRLQIVQPPVDLTTAGYQFFPASSTASFAINSQLSESSA